MALSRLLMLTCILALLAITAIYIALRIFRSMRNPGDGYALISDEDAARVVRKERKERHRPLNLGTAGDCEIDVYELRQRSAGNGVGASCVDLGSEKYSGLGLGKLAGREGDAEGEVLTPFTPARARARRYGAGDAEGRDAEDEDELGLGRYFFSDGVGIKRYVSWGLERGWRDG